MQIKIRNITQSEIHLLDDFLYNAIFVPEGYGQEVPRDIIYNDPQCYASIKEFGKEPDDYCLVAEADGKVVGAVWARISDEYGHIDDETPSLAISLYKEYRSQGIGTKLMASMIDLLKQKQYKRISLGVNKENYAVRLYEKAGFKIIGDGANDTEWLMLKEL